MAGGGINNSEGRGIILTGELVEETEVNMEAIYHIKVFCGDIWVTG